MSKKVIFKLQNGNYREHSDNDDNLNALTLFLFDDIGCDKRSLLDVKKWLLDPEKIEFNFNLTSIEKEDQLILLSADLFNFFMEIGKDNFTEIMRKWEKICEERPKEILITKEGNEVTVEGKN